MPYTSTKAELLKYRNKLDQGQIHKDFLLRLAILFLPIMLFILFIYLFGFLVRFQHCIGHITIGSWKGRGNQYIQLVRVLYCKLLTNSKHLPAFPLKVGLGIKLRSQRWEARVLPLCHRGPPAIHFEKLPTGFINAIKFFLYCRYGFT